MIKTYFKGMSQQFGNIINNSMHNGLQINLKDAIKDVGGIVPENACLWQYPEIIRKCLVAKTIANINLFGKDIINISTSSNDEDLVYNISTSIDTSSLSRPNYANSNTDWNTNMSADMVFADLFDNILPAVRGIHAGDMTTTDGSGNDIKLWDNTLFNKKGNKSGLLPTSKYLRLYLTSQPEPIYVFIDSAVSDLTKGYNIKDSDTVSFSVDDVNMTLSAHISCITNEQLNSIE